MRRALAAGVAGFGLCWCLPAFASETPPTDCPQGGAHLTLQPASTAQEEGKEIAQLLAIMDGGHDPIRHPGMSEAQFAAASATTQLVYSEYVKLRSDWIAARNGAAVEVAACLTLKSEVAKLRASAGAMAAMKELDTLIQVKEKELAGAVEESGKKVTKAKDAYNAYIPRRDFLRAYAKRMGPQPGATQTASSVSARQRFIVQSTTAPCLIDTRDQRRGLQPNLCSAEARDSAEKAQKLYGDGGAGDVPIAGAPIDKRGITVSFTGAQSASDLTLSLTDTFRSRWKWSSGGDFQRHTAWGYRVGVTTGGKNGSLIDFSERDEGDRLTSAFDRLDAKTRLSFSLFRADYGSESTASFDSRSAKFHKAAREACVTAQAKADAFPSTCEGEQLMAWIFAKGTDGGYRHPEHATAFGSLYFAPPPSVKYAQWGFGVNVDVARPLYEYKDLPPGASPTELHSAKLVKDRELTFTVAPYMFFRMPGSGERFGWTLIPSVTLKREYGTEDAVTVCPAATPGDPFSISCGDPFLPQRPERKTYLVPGLEGRFIWSGARIGRFYFPQFGLAPKASFDTDAERWEFTLPGFFAVDSAKSLTAGLSLIYRTGGENDMGDEIKGETGVAIVIGKTFSLDPF